MLMEAGQAKRAESILRGILAELRDAKRSSTQLFADLLSDLAESYLAQGKAMEAVAAHEEAVEVAHARELVESGSPRYTMARVKLADAYMQIGQHAQAVEIFKATLPQMRKGLGKSHESCRTTMSKL